MSLVRPILVASAVAFAGCAGHAATSSAPTPSRAPAAQAPAAPAAPAPLRYGAGTGHYRLESQSHVEQDAMGQTTAFDLVTGVVLSTATAPDTAGNLGVAITIDSLSITSPTMPMAVPPAADLAAARGRVVRLVVSTQGQTIGLTPPDSAGVALRQVAQGLREFLPMLPPGAPTPGTSWSDTSSMATPSQGGTVTVHLTRQHRVVGWEDHEGTRALHLATTVAYTVTGTSEAQGQSVELSGGGQRNGDAFVTAAGVYLGGTMSDSSLVNASIASAGLVVPVRTRSHSSFTRLP
ncbi:MAG TPA: hypothetical protein VEH62_01975 [Gemmatimonadales bacterium]|nr:hypothetical protein [Gemmatimonadales bacterium]